MARERENVHKQSSDREISRVALRNWLKSPVLAQKLAATTKLSRHAATTCPGRSNLEHRVIGSSCYASMIDVGEEIRVDISSVLLVQGRIPPPRLGWSPDPAPERTAKVWRGFNRHLGGSPSSCFLYRRTIKSHSA
jgi:hypothetical protein